MLFRKFKWSFWQLPVETNTCRYDQKLLTEQRNYGQEQFDKLIVYLSGGALTLSIGFVKDLIGPKDLGNTVFLKWAWFFFAASLCANLLSHKTSVLDADSEIKGKNRRSEAWGKITELFNWVSLILFVLGLWSFVTFAYPKLNQREGDAKTEELCNGSEK